MFNSSKYWNDRYVKGGNSGAGSYNNLALFKANIINNFIDKNKIQSIIDYGVGDGNQLKLLNTNTIKYTGIDVSDVIVNKCKEMFNEDKDKTFINVNDIDTTLKADLVLSCDVIYHLIEDNVYLEYMNKLFSMSNKYVIIYSKNENINHAQHVKFRKFTDYIDEFLPMWNLIEFIPNQYPQTKLGANNNNTSPSDFYIYGKNITYNLVVDHKKIDLLFTGCGSSGTKYISELLKINNIDVGHDFSPIGKMGFVSNAVVNDEVWLYDKLKYPFEILNTKIPVSYFSTIIHIVRHPLLVIPSIIQKWNNHNKIWLHIKDGVLASEEDKSITILNAMKYWLYHNKHISQLTNKIIKFEDILKNGDIINKYINNTQQITIKTLNKTINSSNTKIKVDWNTLFQIDKHITNKIIKLCNSYGYETPNENIPIYISLTSIYQNQDILLDTLKSIINQTIKPDKIFLYLSEEEYLLDSGFKNKKITNNNLLNFITDNNIIDLIWVKNTGSYRKLLPLLENKWNEDCVIITIDDDTIYDENLIKNLIDDYSKYKCVIGYRGFTPNYTNEHDFDYNKRHSKLHNISLYNFLTGKGGVLYNPQFFHKTKSLIFNDNIYMNTCKTHDDIWFYILRMLNNINCYINNKKWMVKDNSKTGLYLSYNTKNNGNTHAFKNTINLLKNNNYQNYIPF